MAKLGTGLCVEVCRVVLFAFLVTAGIALHAQSQDVLTYHVDNFRTGWFSSETQLNQSNVNSSQFGLLFTVALDARVDAEPLVVTGQAIQGQGTHDVVYVATEGNSVYAIDLNSAAILWHTHFGTPVPYQYKNYDDNVYPIMGILSTPVIDLTAGRMYFVADSLSGGGDVFRLHAISLSTGLDVVNPAAIQFSEHLWDGTVWTFNPKYHLQRPALLEANNSIYVAFGSNGDIDPDQSRGTILRFDANTLNPLTGQITDKLHFPTSQFYLSSIWGSGYGPSTDASGDIFFTTGNSDPNRPSYYQNYNRPDSMVRLSSDLGTLKDSFTTYDYYQLDQGDVDVGSGGMLLLPDQPGSMPHLAVAGGKDGRSFLINRDSMGGYTPGGPNRVVQTVTSGACWCGPAYFVGSDGVPRVLTGGGNGVTSFKLQTSPSVELIEEGTTGPGPVNGLPDNGGSIPVVSSNGTTAGTGIVWFVQKPATSSDQDPGTPVTLMAYSASDLTQQLFSTQAGTWTHASNSNANIVPTVSNGRVYIGSNKQLQIFGLLNGHAAAVAPRALTPSQPAVVACTPEAQASKVFSGENAVHEFYGTVCRLSGSEMQVALRGARSLTVDIGGAFAQHREILLSLGRPVHVRAALDGKGALHAQQITPSHLPSAATPPDR